ncbi:MAG: pyrimidine-nucleoside phosphorylase, partial [Syntrophomonadaceae bacterium]|nr:pyrimidine-nucleoside phosphorylase [Syntrophomonadaceae bacterium]
KVGQGAFMKNREEANELARTMLAIGKGAGRNVIAVLSDMNQPLGMMIGNSLEVKEAIKTLQGNGPADLEGLSIHLAANMVLLGGKAGTYDQARDKVKNILASGQGLKKFEEWVQAQKGCLDLGDPDFGLRPALIKKEVNAFKTGYIHSIDALQVGRLAMSLGAGRERFGDIIDHSVGIELLKKQGDFVQRNEPLAIIHSSHWQGVESTEERLVNAFNLTDNPVKTDPIIIETLY